MLQHEINRDKNNNETKETTEQKIQNKKQEHKNTKTKHRALVCGHIHQRLFIKTKPWDQKEKQQQSLEITDLLQSQHILSLLQ